MTHVVPIYALTKEVIAKKGFLKEIYETRMVENDYPQYRRRFLIYPPIGNRELDNIFVVPYNPYLFKKYNAHINVEECTNIKSGVKYI